MITEYLRRSSERFRLSSTSVPRNLDSFSSSTNYGKQLLKPRVNEGDAGGVSAFSSPESEIPSL